MVRITSIGKFQGEYDWLNNQYFIKLPYDGIVYPSVTHAYAASKTNDPFLRRKLSVSTFKVLEDLSQSIGARLGWHGPTVMKDLLEIKFGLNMVGVADERMTMYKKLAGTGKAKLIFGNLQHENFWGNCTCLKCTGAGTNLLGHALEATRERVRARIELTNNLRRQCRCGKKPTRWLLWSREWSSILTPTCDYCLAPETKIALDECTDGFVNTYPEEFLVTPSLILSPPEKETMVAKVEKPTSILSDPDYDFCCGVPVTTNYASTTTERKWESMVWKGK